MKKRLFSKSQMIELERNPNVLRVTEQAITYDPDFKVKAVLENIKGESPTGSLWTMVLTLISLGKGCLENSYISGEKFTMSPEN